VKDTLGLEMQLLVREKDVETVGASLAFPCLALQARTVIHVILFTIGFFPIVP
jgi:hypothetical protein